MVESLGLLIALVVAAGPPSRAETMCTLVGCASGAGTELVQPREGWRAGTYEASVSFKGIVLSCSLPFTPGHFEDAVCTTPAGGPSSADEHPDSLRFELTQNGGSIYLYGAWPTVMEIRLKRDGRLVAHSRFYPIYKVKYPNGIGCGVCAGAQLDPLVVSSHGG